MFLRFALLAAFSSLMIALGIVLLAWPQRVLSVERVIYGRLPHARGARAVDKPWYPRLLRVLGVFLIVAGLGGLALIVWAMLLLHGPS